MLHSKIVLALIACVSLQSHADIPPSQIQTWLAGSKPSTRFALHQLEMTLDAFVDNATKSPVPGVDYAVLTQKLFIGSTTIYAALSSASLNPIAKGSCAGGADADTQGQPPQICFSLENLSGKLDASAAESQLEALIIKELAVSLGTTDHEAHAVELLIQHSVANSVFDTSTKIADDFANRLQTATQNAIDLGAKGISSRYYCVFLTSLLGQVSKLLNESDTQMAQLGILVPNPQGAGELFAAMVKASNMATICSDTGDRAPTGRLGRLYAGRNEVPLQDYAAAMGFSTWGRPPQAKIRWIDVKDSAENRNELADIVNYLESLQAQLN